MFYYSLLATECKLISSKYATLDMLCLREHTYRAYPEIFSPKKISFIYC